MDLFGQQTILQNPASLPHRPDIAQYIEGMLYQMAINAVVVVIGPGWADTTDAQGQRALDNPYDSVRVQIAAALRLGMSVIPVQVDGARFPSPETLPPDIQPLLKRNGIPLREGQDFERDVQRLTRALSHWVAPLPLPLDEARRLSRGANLRWGLGFAGLVTVIGLLSNALIVSMAYATHSQSLADQLSNATFVIGAVALICDLFLFFLAGYFKVRSLGAWASGSGAGMLAGVVGGVACGIIDTIAMSLYMVATIGASGRAVGLAVGMTGAVIFTGLDIGLGVAFAALGGKLARRQFARPLPAQPYAPVYSATPPSAGWPMPHR
jgi:hypothetical protein